MEEKNTQTKVCKRCGRELPVDQFGKHAKTKDGLNPYCRECMSKSQKEAAERRKRRDFPEIPADLSRPRVTPEVIEKLEELENTVNSYAEKIKDHPWPNLSGFDDEDLIHELSDRGWTGRIVKTITVSYHISPDGIEIE